MAEGKHLPKSDAASDDKDAELQIHDSTRLEESEQSELKEPDEQTKPEAEPQRHAMDEAEDKASDKQKQPKPKKIFSRMKKILIGVAVAIIAVAVISIIPTTRYAVAGLVVKKDITIALVDGKTGKSVSGVAVSLGGKTVVSDAHGNATFKAIAVGNEAFTAKKHYYQDLTSTVLVPIFGSKSPYQLSVVATGRQVPVKIVNKITNQPVEKATVTFDGATSTTDNQGSTVMVLPADKTSVTASITADNYNQQSTDIQVTEQQDPKNTFAIVPSGKVYFLSKRTGTINVMKSDLDGGNAQVVLAGTGNESDTGTVLLASRDWKYLALQSSRDGNKDKLYLIDTAQGDKLTTIDEGDASFSSVGWYNQYFMYTTSRNQVQNWQPKKNALKSFNAQTGQLTVLDESDAAGDQNASAQQYFSSLYILDNLLVYVKYWNGYNSVAKQPAVYAVQPNGQQKQTLKTFNNNDNIQAQLYEPQGIYFQVSNWTNGNYNTTFYKYEDRQFQTSDISAATYSKFYPTYLVSPSGKSTFWYEPRDGKNTLFVGDSNGSNVNQIASLSEYTPYGWYGEDYLLVSKGGSELYILSPSTANSPLKITDYHKANINLNGYGYGYGGNH